jgi:hypothetical protein
MHLRRPARRPWKPGLDTVVMEAGNDPATVREPPRITWLGVLGEPHNGPAVTAEGGWPAVADRPRQGAASSG